MRLLSIYRSSIERAVHHPVIYVTFDTKLGNFRERYLARRIEPLSDDRESSASDA